MIRVAHVATVDLTVRFLLLPQLRRLCDEGYEVTAISAPGPWTGAVEAEGIRHLAWPSATRAWDPVADARAFRELVAILRREQFDLVHTHTPKAGVLGRLAARAAGVATIVNTVHGYYATPQDRARRRLPVMAVEALAARCSDLELFQSEEDLAWARRAWLAPPDRMRLLGNGVDTTWFAPDAVGAERAAEVRRELGLADTDVVVGTTGRLVAEKGYGELFSAVARIRRSDPSVRLLAVGADAPRHPPEGAVFAGWREDVRELLAAMDVFVLASWREGVPRSAIEAAAMGRAMVLTDIRGCREVARDGREALLVPPHDVDALADAIERLVRDKDMRRDLGAAARERALARFDERDVMERIVAAYRDLLGAAPGSVGDAAVRIRPAREADARAMARLHRASMPSAFLPSLGDAFLAELYRAVAREPGAVALVADNGAGVVGFATGVASVGGFYRSFAARHGVRAAALAAPSLLRRDVLRKVAETARYPAAAPEGLPPAEVLAIAVDDAHRRDGIGRRLLAGVLEGLADAGASRARVVVDAANEGANRFYASMGFEPAARVVVHRGTESRVWVIGCRSPSRSPSA